MGEKEADLLTQISQICLERGVFVIDDMVYRDITYDKNNIAKPIATIPGMFRNTITLLGLSKSYGMASLRAGFLIADEIIIREVINRIFQEMDSNTANLILQDVNLIKERLEFAKKISAVNQGQKLKQGDKVGKNNNIIHYKSFERLVNVIPDEWTGKEDLKSILSSLDRLPTLDNKSKLNKEERLEVEREICFKTRFIFHTKQINRNRRQFVQ